MSSEEESLLSVSKPLVYEAIARLLVVLSETERRSFFTEEMLEELSGMGEVFKLVDPSTLGEAEWWQMLHEVQPDVLVACWSCPPLPENLPSSLEYVCYLAGSVRQLIDYEHIRGGLSVSNWGGAISRTVAEWTLFHILGCLREAGYWIPAMHRDGAWKSKLTTKTKSLFEKKIGIHGYGKVARELVRLLKPFDVSISVCAPDITVQAAQEDGILICPDLGSLFGDNDIIVELAPLTPETVHIVQERHLRLIQHGGTFINLARADLVDQDALLRVAQEGKVRFGLDVFDEEPLPAEHPLRGLSNVILTPHIAGPTTDRCIDAGRICLANLEAYRNGRPLDALITPEIYEQSS